MNVEDTPEYKRLQNEFNKYAEQFEDLSLALEDEKEKLNQQIAQLESDIQALENSGGGGDGDNKDLASLKAQLAQANGLARCLTLMMSMSAAGGKSDPISVEGGTTSFGRHSRHRRYYHNSDAFDYY